MFLQASFWFRRSTTAATATAARTKKSSKTVRFSGVDTVQYTHSSAEYDRSSFSDRRQQLRQLFEVSYCQQQFNKDLSSSTYSSSSSTLNNKRQQKPPMLRIDTQVALGGPLFLTQMSTNYGRPCRQPDDFHL